MTSMSTSVGGDMWQGQTGLRIRRLDEGLGALVDYGSEHLYLLPRVVRVLDEAQIRRLMGDFMDVIDPDLVTQPPAWLEQERERLDREAADSPAAPPAVDDNRPGFHA